MTSTAVFVGVDIAKADFVVACRPVGTSWTALNDVPGITDTVARVRDPLPGNQLPMPPKNRIRGNDRGDLGQAPTPEAAAAELRPKHPTLLNEVLQDYLLALSDPARKGQ
jgi:hypothetical protein